MMADNDFDNSEMESFKTAAGGGSSDSSFKQKGSNLSGEKTKEFNSNDEGNSKDFEDYDTDDGDFGDEVLVPETPENNNENDDEGSRNHRSNGTNSDKV